MMARPVIPEVDTNLLILDETSCIFLQFWIPRKILGIFHVFMYNVIYLSGICF